MKNIERTPDEEVVVKLAKCSKCNGIITAAVKHMMTKKDIRDMGNEAIQYNHIISEKMLSEYRTPEQFWCTCKS